MAWASLSTWAPSSVNSDISSGSRIAAFSITAAASCVASMGVPTLISIFANTVSESIFWINTKGTCPPATTPNMITNTATNAASVT